MPQTRRKHGFRGIAREFGYASGMPWRRRRVITGYSGRLSTSRSWWHCPRHAASVARDCQLAREHLAAQSTSGFPATATKPDTRHAPRRWSACSMPGSRRWPSRRPCRWSATARASRRKLIGVCRQGARGARRRPQALGHERAAELYRDRCRHGRVVVPVEIDERVVLALLARYWSARRNRGPGACSAKRSARWFANGASALCVTCNAGSRGSVRQSPP